MSFLELISALICVNSAALKLSRILELEFWWKIYKKLVKKFFEFFKFFPKFQSDLGSTIWVQDEVNFVPINRREISIKASQIEILNRPFYPTEKRFAFDFDAWLSLAV